MSEENAFQKASERVQNLKNRPSNAQLLKLYALYKQGSSGDVKGKRPGLLDMKARAKYDAWSQVKGMDPLQAQKEYIDFVSELFSADG